VVDRLCARLAAAGVRYCHWKSNEALGRSLSGDNDLDLLIDRADAAAFRAVLADLGAVEVRQPAARRVLGLEDFLLLDDATGRIVHVQPHFELIVGDDMTKSFRLPVEQAMLAGAEGKPLPVPPPAVEYLVFLIRMTIKHCPLEALVARKGRLTGSERRELAWLEERIDPTLTESSRAALFPHVDSALWQSMRAAAQPGSSLVFRARTGRRLLRSLRSDSRRSLPIDTGLKVARRIRGRLGRESRMRKTLARGGLFVAVVGGDGSGKSSLVESIVAGLSSTIAVQRVHLGKPPRGFLNRVVTRPLRVLRNRGAFGATRLPAWNEFDRHPGIVYSLWHWLIARDRLRAYVHARRSAGRGMLVVSDRFPLAELSSMDGPRLQGLPAVGRSGLAGLLARSEAAQYRRIRPPDLVLVLRVAPEVAVARRGEQDTGFVDHRATEVWDADWQQPGVVVLDASAPAAAVTRAALTEIWRRL
jgi:thymidylate kinase